MKFYLKEIARILNRHRKTIKRERLKRNEDKILENPNTETPDYIEKYYYCCTEKGGKKADN